MKIKDRMSKNPTTVGPNTSVDQALGIMRERGVRHLPVVEDGAVVGLVNDIELRTAWFPSLLDELVVKDVMVSDPVTVEANASVYQAARLLYTQKLTGLLVVDNGVLAGIITLADILKIFVDLLGLLGETSRVNVVLGSKGQDLKEVYELIDTVGCGILGVNLVSDLLGRKVYALRLDCHAPDEVIQILEESGYEVIV